MPSSLDSCLSVTLMTHRVHEDLTLHAIESMMESSDTAWQC